MLTKEKLTKEKLTKEKKVYRTCGPGDLEILTRDGWSLTKVLQSDKMIDVQEDVAHFDEAPQRSDGYYRAPAWQHACVTRKVVVADTLFLLEKDESTVIAELEVKVKEVEAKASASDAEKKKAEKDLAELKARAVDERAYAARVNDMLEKSRREVSDLEKTKNRMEADLAKVQRAVGELRMHEIVGGSA